MPSKEEKLKNVLMIHHTTQQISEEGMKFICKLFAHSPWIRRFRHFFTIDNLAILLVRQKITFANKIHLITWKCIANKTFAAQFNEMS